MLSHNHRLAKTRDVQAVFARGRGFLNPFFTVKFLKAPRLDKRFTVVASTKVSKKAVTRNRLKRILREFIRLKFSGFLPGDYAVVIKPAATKLEAKDLLEQFEKLLRDSQLLQ